MNPNNSYHWRKQVMWGLLVTAIGAAFLLDQMNMLDLDDLWHYWPLVMVVVGGNRVIGYPTARDFSAGLWTMFIGLWLFANFEHIAGLTFQNSWPYLVIFWGVTMVLRPFVRERFATDAPAQECRHEN